MLNFVSMLGTERFSKLCPLFNPSRKLAVGLLQMTEPEIHGPLMVSNSPMITSS